MFINVSNQLPKTSYIKMTDVWLIFNLSLPFIEVLLHTYKVNNHGGRDIYHSDHKDYLRGEEKREVNHHGRKRTIGDDTEEDTEVDNQNKINVLQNNWVENSEQFDLNLISRHEDVQVRIG